MTKVAAVIATSRTEDMERQAREALRQGADLVELRLDAISDLTSEGLRRLAHGMGPRAIATLRSRSQGGLRDYEPTARHALLLDLCKLGFRYVDVELDTDAEHLDAYVKAASGHHQDVIVSHHFDRPVETSDAMDALGACLGLGDVGKVALPVADVEQAAQIVECARNMGLQRKRFVLIGMGPAGMVTRALAEDVRQEIQYAAMGGAVVPGQLALTTALRLRGATPLLYGLVGHPLGHSLSPVIQEAAFASLRLPAAYLPFDMEARSLEAFLQASDRLRLRGFNVTVPHKEAVVNLLDELGEDAEALGAVNTVVLEDGWAKGHNTDVHGFRVTLRSLGLRLGGRRALVIGAGGAAKAVVHVLLREGAQVEVANRTAARAHALAEAFDEPVEVLSLEELPGEGPWDLLVHATPAGTQGLDAPLPVAEPVVKRAAFVYDLVYNPREPPLLRMARRLGIPGTSGLEMLLHQAAKAFELWTGKPAPFEAMRAAAQEALS